MTILKQHIEFWKPVFNLKRKIDGQIVRDSKLVFALIGWNSVTPTDYSTIKSVQKKFANLCYNRFFFNLGFKEYEKIFDRLNLSPLHLRQWPLDSLFLMFSLIFMNKITCFLSSTLLVYRYPL
jgi:hypothetical protein